MQILESDSPFRELEHIADFHISPLHFFSCFKFSHPRLIFFRQPPRQPPTLGLLEELLPLTDFVPTATLCWARGMILCALLCVSSVLPTLFPLQPKKYKFRIQIGEGSLPIKFWGSIFFKGFKFKFWLPMILYPRNVCSALCANHKNHDSFFSDSLPPLLDISHS